MALGRATRCRPPQSDGCQFDEGKVVGREFVIACGDTPTLLDLVEELLDEVARAVQVGAKANRLASGYAFMSSCPSWALRAAGVIWLQGANC